MGIVRLPLIVDAFFGGLLFSVFCLSWAWRIALNVESLGSIPKMVICLLSIALGDFLWNSLFLPSLKGARLSSLHRMILLYLSLVGATQQASPGDLASWSWQKSWRPNSLESYHSLNVMQACTCTTESPMM